MAPFRVKGIILSLRRIWRAADVLSGQAVPKSTPDPSELKFLRMTPPGGYSAAW